MKIDILGTEYDYEVTTEKKDEGLYQKGGYCDQYAKNIVIEDEYSVNNPDSTKNIDTFKQKVKRHEIIHAYLAESGLHSYFEDEVLVDWIAWQFPKLLKTFRQIDALNEGCQCKQ